MCRSFCLAVLSLLVLASGAVPVAASPPAAVWRRPVDGPVVRSFAEGTGPFGIGGHAGTDLGASVGDDVRVAGDGVVAFAGTVAGDRFVVVAHSPELRTTYGYLAEVVVRRGQRVEAGDVMGHVGGGGRGGHGPGVLHFGLRDGDRYLDPMALFGPPDLTEMVRLIPVDEPGVGVLASAVGERRGLLAELRRGGGLVRRVMKVLGRGVGAGAMPARRWLVRQLGEMVAVGAVATGRQVSELQATAMWVLWESGVAARQWWRQRGRCSGEAVAASATAADGHHVMAVAGVNSSTRADGSTFGLPVARLGYEPGEVHWFSYAGDGGAYGRADTHTGPAAGAALLAEQLRRLAAARPGMSVDLVGHSQGGVVIEVFLKRHYGADPSAYPPLGRVVTLAAPHRGAPLATEARQLAAVPGLGVRVDGLARRAGQPATASGTTRDLAEPSDLVHELRRTPLPSGVAMTTIGALGDYFVTADRTSVRGAAHVVVDPGGMADHSSIVDAPEAVDAVRLALAGRPPPCTSLLTMVRGRVEPMLIRRAISLTDQLVARPLR